MRRLSLVLVGLVAVVVALLPSPGTPRPGPLPELQPPAIAVCVVEEGSGLSTILGVASTTEGSGHVTALQSGETRGREEFRIGPSGSELIAAVDVAAVGAVAGLVELPDATSAAASLITGSASVSGETCASVPSSQSFITGGSTTSGEAFELHLMNPYSARAVVDLVVQSGVGFEADDRLKSVVVPARSSSIVDFNTVLPGRETLSITIETLEGNVIGVGRQRGEGKSAMWRAVAPAQDWFVPVPTGETGKRLLIATPSETEVEYQLDLYGPNGLEEGFRLGTLAPRGQEVVGLAGDLPEEGGIRVISAGPVVPTLVVDAGAGLAATTGGSVSSPRWALPGAGRPAGGMGSMVVINPGIDGVTVRVRGLGAGAGERSLDLPAAGVIEIPIGPAQGHLVEATGPVVVLWTSQTDVGIVLALGQPLDDG